ncbi:MAG: haloacid dehalogenase-like hydrolase [Verrucomicrobium sp.]|nr:haloacid dehalogenase-like hydrolase [Verrucomicrobium sp.]
MKLILWDIDGTLLDTGRAGQSAFYRAWKEITGIDSPPGVVDFRGRTDTFIARQLHAHFNVPWSEESVRVLHERYLENLAAELPRATGTLHPGILEILEAVRLRSDLAQGLLTGNLQRGARLKLEHYKVWHYFEFGAFADDSAVRNELGPFALSRARDRHGRDFKPEEVFIVGDTPHDVACAQAIGARSIGVGTGHFPAAELAACGATAVLDDLSDPAAFFAVVDRV